MVCPHIRPSITTLLADQFWFCEERGVNATLRGRVQLSYPPIINEHSLSISWGIGRKHIFLPFAGLCKSIGQRPLVVFTSQKNPLVNSQLHIKIKSRSTASAQLSAYTPTDYRQTNGNDGCTDVHRRYQVHYLPAVL